MTKALLLILLACVAHAQSPISVMRYDGVCSFPVPTTTAPGIAVTSVSTFTGPRNLIYASQTWNCTQTGLYRFHAPLGSGANRIVWAGDVPRLMSALSWVHSWGSEDNGMAIGAMGFAAGVRQLRTQCGLIVAWAKAVCDSVPLTGAPPFPQTRICRVLTAEQPNNWYDGHALLEARHADGAWRLYDITNGLTFGDPAAALKDAVPLNLASTPPVKICQKLWSVTPPASGFDVGAFCFARMTNDAQRDEDLAHVMQIPGIDDGGLTWFYLPAGMESRASWVLSLSATYRVLTKSDWLARFYP